MPTKDELEAENAELRAELEELRNPVERDVTGTGRTAAAPARPVGPDGAVQLTEGERQDLVANGVTTSPFTGETLNALDELDEDAVAALEPTARRRAERQKARATEVTGNEWPVSGPPPAAGGDTDPTGH